MVIAALGVLRRAEWHVALSLVGSFAALLVGLALLLAQLDAGETGPLLFVWVGVIVASVAALVMSLGPGAPQVSSAVRRVQIVAVAGIGLGVAQFVFTTVYGPTPAGPHLEVRGVLQRLGEKDDLVAVKAQITLKNSGQRSIVVVDSVYRVKGDLVLEIPDKRRTFRNKIVAAAKANTPGLDHVDETRDVDRWQSTMVQAGQIIDRGFWFEPGESSTREFVFYVPDGRYDLLGLSAELTIGEHRLLNLDEGPTVGPKTETHVYPAGKFVLVNTSWSIPESSWVRSLIRGEKVLWSRWMLAGPAHVERQYELPVVFAYVDKQGAAFDPWLETTPDRVLRLSSQYGVVSTHAHAELSLFPRG
jgi:hypothetical protein